jgi:4-aminobutyrate aminotransferase
MPAILVQRDADRFFHQVGSSPCIGALRAVSGIWLEDDSGRRLIDLHGNTTHHIGHANPQLVAALKLQLDSLTFSPRRYTNEPAVQLAEHLTDLWPGPAARVLFTTGGSDAIEVALKLARVATGRSATLSLEGSYHGHGFGAFGLSHAHHDPRLGSFLPDRVLVTPYWDKAGGGADAMLAQIEQALATTPGGIAALIAEPIRSNCHVPPDHLWREVRRLCDAAGTLLIFDEIPSGLGKTGRFFAFEHFGVVPDAVVLGKSLGGGMLPIAAVIADARLNVAPELALGHYTHEKNPLTTRAAATTVEIIVRDNLAQRAARLEDHVRQRVALASASCPAIKGIRGRGLLLAIELDLAVLGGARPALGDAIIAACLEHGVSTTTKGEDALGFSPPLTITEDEIDLAIDSIAAALRCLACQPGLNAPALPVFTRQTDEPD